MNKATKKSLGVFFILIGLIILLTPFTPGSIILLVGMDLVFGDEWPWWNRTKAKILGYFKYGKHSK